MPRPYNNTTRGEIGQVYQCTANTKILAGFGLDLYYYTKGGKEALRISKTRRACLWLTGSILEDERQVDATTTGYGYRLLSRGRHVRATALGRAADGDRVG